MMRSRQVLLVLALVAGAAAPVQMSAQQVSTAVVPVVGSAFGATMARWMSDVEIENASPFPADIVIELPSYPDALLAFTLGPNERQRYTDIVGQAFGLDNVLSAMRVTSSRAVVVRATAYAVNGDGISPLQPIDVYYRNMWAPFRVLDNLAFSESFRTNIGLVNFSERDAQFVLALQRLPGRDLAVSIVNVPAGAMMHNSIQSLFPMITAGTGFLVVIESSERDTYVYGSVIESERNAARFITARVGTR